MAGHTPWSEIKHKADGEQRFWHDLRFVHFADSQETSQAKLDELFEVANRLGFELELGDSTSVPPKDLPFGK